MHISIIPQSKETQMNESNVLSFFVMLLNELYNKFDWIIWTTRVLNNTNIDNFINLKPNQFDINSVCITVIVNVITF